MSYIFEEIGEAVEDGNVEDVRLLMDELSHEEAVSQLGQRGESGKNIVWKAAKSGNAEILEALLKKLGDSANDIIRQKDEDGSSAVHAAVVTDNVEAVQLLFMALKEHEIKDCILQKDNSHHAVICERVEVVKAVLNRLGSSEERVQAIAMKDEYGATALHVAASCGNEDVFNLLADTVHLGARDDNFSAIEMFKLKDGAGHSLHLAAAYEGNFNIFKRVWEELGDDVSLHAVQENVDVLGAALWTSQMTKERNAWFVDKVKSLLDHLGDKAEDFICSTLPRRKTLLHAAAKGGYEDVVKILLDHLGVKAEDFIRFTASTLLRAAAAGGHEAIVRILLDRLGKFARYDILRKDLTGSTVFHAAATAQCNNVPLFKLLVEKIGINRKALMEDEDLSRSTVLHLAARSDQSTGILELILEQLGSEAQLVINTQKLLRLAVVSKNPTGVELLLDKLGPDQAEQAIGETDSVTETDYSEDGHNLLHEAATSGNSHVFKMLMVALGPKLSEDSLSMETTERGFTIHHGVYSPDVISQQTTERRNTVLHLVTSPELVKLIRRTVGQEKCKRLICQENTDGETALWARGRNDFTNVFKEMANCLEAEELKREVRRRNKQGRTLLHQLVVSGNVNTFKDMVETLGEESTIQDCFQVPDNNGDTVLHHAVTKFARKDLNDIFVRIGGEQLRILLKRRNNNNETPLHSARCVRLLVKAAGMSAEEIKGILGGGPGHEHRALHVACEMGNEFLVRLLLQDGCKDDIMKPDELFLGNTVLHAAAIGKNVQVFKMLEDDMGAALQIDHCINWYGQTPLHFAAATTWNKEMLEHLIKDKGADPCKPDHAGATPVHFAMRCWRPDELLELLKTQGFDISKSNKVTKAGLTPLHYAAWNGGNSYALLDSFRAESETDLEAVDNVEHLSPFLWTAITGASWDMGLVDEYISAGKNPLPEEEDKLFWTDGFLIPPPNFCMEYTCLEMIESSFALTKALVACTLVYGTDEANQQLAKRLLDGNQDSCKVHEMLADSHAFQLVVMSSKLDSTRKATLSAFLEEISTKSSEGDKRDGILSKLQEQLQSALAIALEKRADDGFIRVLVKHMQKHRVRELLQARLCEVSHSLDSFKGKYKKLSSIEKSKLKDVKSLLEDIPLAYWIALLQQQMNKQEVATAASENEDEQKESIKLAIAIVMKIIGRQNGQEDAAGDPWSPVDTEYPNTIGRHTGRTALHWAVIFREQHIVTELTRDPVCEKDVLDDFGRPAYWYALLHQNQLQPDKQAYINQLKWDKYYESLHKDRNLYVDGLNAILVGAALIATVTFAGLLTPPLQYPVKSSDSTPDLKYVAIYKPGVHLFWVSISMSFFFSITSALACVTGMLPNASAFDLLEVQRIRESVVRAAAFLVLSIVFVLLAFASAGFSVLPSVIKLQANMIVTTFLGGAFCVYRVGKFGKAIYSLTPNNRIQRVVWCTSQLLLKLTAKGEGDRVTEKPTPERRSYKRGSIHEHIVRSGGFSKGFHGEPYSWDDGLWESPFAKEIRPETPQPLEEIVVDTSEAD